MFRIHEEFCKGTFCEDFVYDVAERGEVTFEIKQGAIIQFHFDKRVEKAILYYQPNGLAWGCGYYSRCRPQLLHFEESFQKTVKNIVTFNLTLRFHYLGRFSKNLRQLFCIRFFFWRSLFQA